MTPALAEPIEIAYATGLYALVFAPGAVMALKGQALWLLAGVLFSPLIWWYGAFRLGKPGSWWADRFYAEDKRARAIERYGDVATSPWQVAVAGLLIVVAVALGTATALLA